MQKVILLVIVFLLLSAQVFSSQPTDNKAFQLRVVDRVCDKVALMAATDTAGYACYSQGVQAILSGFVLEEVLTSACSYVVTITLNDQLGYYCFKTGIENFSSPASERINRTCTAYFNSQKMQGKAYGCFREGYNKMLFSRFYSEH